MAEDDDESQKTEEPTHKRLEDARKKGQIVNSREINHFFILLAFTFVICGLLPGIMRETTEVLKPYLSEPHDVDMEGAGAALKLKDTVIKISIIMILPMVLAMVAALAAGGLQTQFNVSAESLKPKLEKISIKKGIGRMFSMKQLMEFIKGIIKISIIAIIAMIAIWPSMDMMHEVPDDDLMEVLSLLATLAQNMLIGICIVMFAIALLDYLYQRYEYMKNLRMTKQEIKDEYKQQEGDPMIKQRLRQIRMERARNRMMANVKEADVVITNPTHYAVALKYNEETMPAPKVVAKGKDKVALRIRELAEKHKITVMRNPPLARGLFDNAEVDDEIPLQYYQAVAEVIGYVYKLKGKAPKQKKDMTLHMPS